MAEDRGSAGGSPERRDPRAADPEAAAREHAESEGIPFEVALADVLASIAKREKAVRRIRAIREEGEARIAAMRAVSDSGEDAEADGGKGSARLRSEGLA